MYNKIYKEKEIMTMKDKRVNIEYDDKGKLEQIRTVVEHEISNDNLDILNAYMTMTDKDPVELVNYDTITNIFNDSITEMFENRDNADHFDINEKYFYVKDGWYNTTDDLSDVFDITEISQYILDNWADFEDYFDEDIFVEEYYDDEDEDDIELMKKQGYIK